MSCDGSFLRFLTFSAFLLCGLASSSIRAGEEQAASKPVARFRRALKASPELLLQQDPVLAKHFEKVSNSGVRAKLLDEAHHNLVRGRAQELRSIPQMLGALTLRDWPTNEDGQSLKFEQIRKWLADRYLSEVRKLLTDGSLPKRLALLQLLSESTVGISWPGEPKGLGRVIGPELIQLIKMDADPHIRVAAALTLGDVFPDPGPAVTALAELAQSAQVAERRAAAQALASMAKLLGEYGRFDPQRNWRPGIQLGRSDLVATAHELLPALSKCLNDSDAEVRRACAEAIQRTAKGAMLRLDPERLEQEAAELPVVRAGYQEFVPLVRDLSVVVAGLGESLGGPDLQARLAANAAIEAIADTRLGRVELVSLGALTGKPDDDPLAGPLKAVAPRLATELTDKEVRIRLAALYALESMHEAALPAVDAVVTSLKDDDPFVRWAAARTLGNLAPLAADKAVAALGAVLNDPNGDVRLGALVALRNYGPAAGAVCLSLGDAANGPSEELRILALNVLANIGKGGRPAAGKILKALTAPETGVRAAAATALGRIGSPAPATVEALLKALRDPDSEVRSAASAALLEP
jgi:HEAT repeat protein